MLRPLFLPLIFALLAVPVAGSSAGQTPMQSLDMGERVIVVLKGGDEVIGEVVEETPDKISVKSAFGVTSIEMNRVDVVIRGEEVDRREYSQRHKRAIRRGSASGWYSLAKWALERGLEQQAHDAFEKTLEIDPEHEAARIALGWGQVDGEWKTPEEAEALIARGWGRDGKRLIPPRGNSRTPRRNPSPKPTEPKPDVVKPGRPTIPESVTRRLDPQQQRRREEQLERRRKEREKFEENKRKEYEGVPWSSRSTLSAPHWVIECNSTPEVARTYRWIMEALHATLSKMFKSPDVRSQKPIVKIYRNHDEFMLKTGMGAGVGGFYQPTSQNVSAYHG
ncbi:MAG TPA: hypothetical protein EYN40_00840, partial [Planctomycetes bacterium]|nr:hypothetical protein [Planctomycetota bacterium]